jgi:hypothetical protein
LTTFKIGLRNAFVKAWKKTSSAKPPFPNKFSFIMKLTAMGIIIEFTKTAIIDFMAILVCYNV